MLDTRNTNFQFFIILGLFITSVIVRVISAEYIDIGGDNSQRWMYAVGLIQDVENMEFSHHSARWAIVVPLWGLLKLVGVNPANYYILPIMVASIGVALIYLIGHRLGGTRLGVVAALMTILFPQMAQSGSQLWPSVFQFTYIAMAIWLLLRKDVPSNVSILFVAVLFFLAWGTRLTAVYFFPGLVLMIWLSRREFKPILVFCFMVGFLCLVEWVAFWLLSGNMMGRIGIIQTSAIQRHVVYETFFDYVMNAKQLVKLKGLLPIFILTVLAALSKMIRGDWRWHSLGFLYFMTVFLMIYMLADINPLTRAGDPSSRFWAASAPFGFLLLASCLLRLREWQPKFGAILIGILLAAFLAFTIKKIPAKNSITQVAADNAILAPVLTERKPILLHWKPWSPNFVEAALYDLFGVSKKPRGSSKAHVDMAIKRGLNRAISFNLEDVSQYKSYSVGGELIQQDRYVFLYIPPGGVEGPPAASVYFDRRAAHAESM